MFKLVIIVTLNHKYNRQGFSIISSTSQYLKKILVNIYVIIIEDTK